MVEIKLDAAENCVHHWKIETPNGRFSQGICSPCGEVRWFNNYLENDIRREDRLETLPATKPTASLLAELNLRVQNANR